MKQTAFPRRNVDEITGSKRPRRLRRTDWMRRLVRETTLSVDDLIWPCFVIDGKDERVPIDAMPDIERRSVDLIVKDVERLAKLGVPAVAPFPNVDGRLKDARGSNILDPDNLICRVTKAIKDAVPQMGVITDVALDPFTDHGHDGVLRDGVIVNDETVELLAQAAVVQAEAGSDVISPSDMMDGRIGAIRDALDAAGYQHVAIMSYTAKFASAFYGPYREAVGTLDLLQGDKKTYYIDPANTEEALRESAADLEEGADMLLIKPGLPYLDICQRVKEHFSVPTYAYQVSGEYSMIKAGAANGWIDYERAMMESVLAFRRAGCDGVFTYFAPEIAERLAR